MNLAIVTSQISLVEAVAASLKHGRRVTKYQRLRGVEPSLSTDIYIGFQGRSFQNRYCRIHRAIAPAIYEAIKTIWRQFRRPMFLLVSLFLVCLPVYFLLFSAEYRNAMCFSLCGLHNIFLFFRLFIMTTPTNSQHSSVEPHLRSVDFVVYCF